MSKTLAMRRLEAQGVPYSLVTFPESIHDALGVASHAGLPAGQVYKTLVVQVVDPVSAAPDRKAGPILILLAGDRELDLKKAARALAVKKVQMARHSEAERLTGLKVGGISPLALLDRGFPVYVDEQAMLLDEVVVSAGQRGMNLRLTVEDLIRVCSARWMDAGRPLADEPDG